MRPRKRSVGRMAGLVTLSLLLVIPLQAWGSEQSTGTLDIRVIEDNDDAEEVVGSGDMYLDSSDLELIRESSDQIVGIRFQNVFIPQGSTITNAYIIFSADEETSETTSLTLAAEASDDAPQFSGSNSNISNRTLTDAVVSWDNIPDWGQEHETGVKQQTPDLSALVEEVVSRDGWLNGNAMAFIISGSGKRVAESYKGSSSKAPLLHVEYTSDAIQVRVSQYNDDAEEKLDQGGDMDLDSSDFDFVDDRLIGIRFQEIEVPKGAEITRAFILLFADENHTNDSRINIDIEAHDNAPVFTGSDSNISDRTLTGSSIQWDPVPDFDSTHEAHQTPDLSSLVQQIVGRSNWTSGNSMVFVLRASQGTRAAETYDGAGNHSNSSLVPMLYIEYGEGEIGIDEPIIFVNTNSIGASVYEGNNPDNDQFTISNTGTGTLEYQISNDADWLSVSSESGTIAAGNSEDITATLNTSGLSVGTHEATITIADPAALNTPIEIQVSVTILDIPEDLTCGNLPVYVQNLVSPAILILLDISSSMTNMMDVSPQVKPQTPNLKDIVQEIVARDGWVENNAMVFIIEGSGKRVAKSFNGSSAEAPLLNVEYSHAGSNYTIENRISHGDDDAEEMLSGSSVNLGSSDLEMIDDGGVQNIGLRFQGVGIPASTEAEPVTVTNAYIEFVIDESNSGDTDLTIHGEDMLNPSEFANTDNNISRRAKTTSSVIWNNIEEWGGVTQQSRIEIGKSAISDLVKDRAIAWGYGTWCNRPPWNDEDESNYTDYTLIHVGTKQNTDTQQTALQNAVDATQSQSGTPFSFSIEAATSYFSGEKKDQDGTGEDYVASDCQPKFLIDITDGQGNTGSTVANTDTRTTALTDAGVTPIGVGFGLDPGEAAQLYKMAEVANAEGDDPENYDIYALHEEIGGVAQPFFANNKQELVEALNTITENVKGAIFHGSAPAPTTSVDLGDTVIVAQFDASRWTGDVDAVTQNENGLWVSKIWTASQELPTNRELWTITDPADPATLTEYDADTLLNDNFQCATDKPIGDVINSTPVVVGYPPFWYPFDGYADFARNLNRDPMIYVGANDGFLHAFRLSDGIEQWNFMPENLHSKLNNADDPLYDRCATEYCHQYYVDGNPIAADVYADFNGDTAKEWRTMLVVGEREGGEVYFALDITSGKVFDDDDPTKYLWQFTDDQLGETWSDPAIDRVLDTSVTGDPPPTTWAAFFGSGYLPTAEQQANKEAYLYGIVAHDKSALWLDENDTNINRIKIADHSFLVYKNLTSSFSAGEVVSGQTSGASATVVAVHTGDLTLELKNISGTFQDDEVITGNASGSAQVDGATASGQLTDDALASPLVVDMEGDYMSDRIYVGNLFGNMYRVSSIGKGMSPEVTTLFTFENTSPNKNPIRAKADYGFAENNGDIWIYFGSGRYETQADKQDNHQQYFFGIKDNSTPEPTYKLSDIVALQAKFATKDINGNSVTLRVVEGSNPLAQSWKMQLYENTFSGGPAASGTERVVSQPLVVAGMVIFTTFIPDQNICAGSGETWVFALDYKTGLAPTNPIFDLNNDGKFDENDKVEFNGEDVVPVGIYVGRGQGSKPVLHKDTLFITTTGDGAVAIYGGGGGGQDFFAKKINIENQKVRLDAWRHK